MDNLEQSPASNTEKEVKGPSFPQASLNDVSTDLASLPSALPRRKGKWPLIVFSSLVFVLLVATGVGAAAYYGYIQLPINIPFIQPDPQQVIKKMYLKMSDLKSVGYGAEMKFNARTEVVEVENSSAEEASGAGLSPLAPKNFEDSGLISFSGQSDWRDQKNIKSNAKMQINFSSSRASMFLGSSDSFKLGIEARGDSKAAYLRVTEMPVLPFFDVSKAVDKWIKFDYSTGTLSQFVDLKAKFQDAEEKSALNPEQEAQIKALLGKHDILKVVKKFPEETIGGKVAYHYGFNLDKAELKLAVEEANKISNGKFIPENKTLDFYKGIDSLNMLDGEMWIGKKDNYLYRFSVASSTYGGESGEKVFISLALLLDLNKFNEPLTIEVPSDAVSIEDLIRSLFGQALFNSEQKAVDAERVADIKQVQTALELYYEDNGYYPPEVDFSGSGSIKTDVNTYMAIVPSNPEPRDSGTCNGDNFSYKVSADGRDYKIIYCLGGESAGIPAGLNFASPSSMYDSKSAGAQEHESSDSATADAASSVYEANSSMDSDDDGLTDREETDIYHTDLNNPDTDGDGFKDGAEVQGGYNPNGPGKILPPVQQ